MDWIFVCLALTPIVMCPGFLFNGFALPQTLAVSLLSTASLVVGVRNGYFYYSTPTILIFVFLIYTFLIALRTHPIHNAKKELGLQIPFLLLFLVLPAYVNAQTIKIYIITNTLVCFLICWYAIGQTKGFDPFFPNSIKQGGPIDNAIGTIGNPNFLAAYLSGSFWLSIYAGVSYHATFLIVSMMILWTLYKTKSRAGQLAIMFSALFFILYLAKQQSSNGIFNLGLALMILGVIFAFILFKINWKTFWHSRIDPKGKQVWFASFRYRLCYWLVACNLIKKKWLMGWGLWGFRKEIYQGQAEMNDKYPGFMDRERYITPQPRECHNDWLEYIFEYGILGASLLYSVIAILLFDGFDLVNGSLLNLILLTNLISIIIDAIFFFALRIPASAIQFWMTSIFILSLSDKGEIFTFQLPSWMILIIAVLSGIFIWECVGKRTITSRYFMKSMRFNGLDRYFYLCKAMFFSPHDTMLRTHAMMATADYSPVLAYDHAMKSMEHFDGQITGWGVNHNFVLSCLKGYKYFFDIMTYYLKQGHYFLNYFNPINELLSSKGGVSLKTQYKRGAKMREMEETKVWQIRSFIANMDSANKDIVILQKEMENFQLKIQNAQNQIEILRGNIENLVLYEKKRMNIPDDWIFDSKDGFFKDPNMMSESEQKRLEEVQNG